MIVDQSQLTKEDYLEKANRDLTEVEQIAGRGNMLIFLIEAALKRCRLALVLAEQAQARIKLDEAKALVTRTERPYEPHVPQWDGWEPPESIGLFGAGEMVGYYRRYEEIAALEERFGVLGWLAWRKTCLGQGWRAMVEPLPWSIAWCQPSLK